MTNLEQLSRRYASSQCILGWERDCFTAADLARAWEEGFRAKRIRDASRVSQYWRGQKKAGFHETAAILVGLYWMILTDDQEEDA